MKRQTAISMCLAAGLAWTVAAGAQSPADPAAQGQPRGTTGQQQTQAVGMVTLDGCIEQATSPTAFTLNVREVASGAAAIGGRTLVGKRVELNATGQVSLKEHAGHHVRVTGTLAPQGTGRGEQAGVEARLNVTKVEHVAATCPPAGTTGTTPQRPGQPPARPEQTKPDPEPRPDQR